MSGHRVQGFTLLEVLVALAIVALGMTAALLQATQSSRTTLHAREQVLASWIADNLLNEWTLSGEPLDVSERSGSLDYARQRWTWTATITETTLPGMLRV